MHFETLFERRIILYGAGITGVETYKVLRDYFRGTQIAGFCDTYKQGQMSGLPILSPSELQCLCAAEPLVVIAVGLAESQQAIIETLHVLELVNCHMLTLAQFDALVLDNIGDVRIAPWYRTIMAGKASLPSDSRRSLYQHWWCPEHYSTGDILVYQPGKVGSSTVCNSLSTAGVGVTHVHMLTSRFLFDLVPELAWEPNGAESSTIQALSDYCTGRMRSSERLKIITLVREPLSRDFSHFVYHMGELKRNGGLADDVSLVAACAEGMLRRATQNGKCAHGYQFDWFDAELKTVFGVDVYNKPMNREQGYSILRGGSVDVLVLKLEKLNSLAQVIGEFAGASNLKLINVNEGRTKKTGDLYLRLRQSVKLSHEIVSLYYEGNMMMDHFYSEQEKRNFLEQWRENIEN